MCRMRLPFSVQTPADRPYGRVVRLLDGFRRGPEGEHRQDRSEDLLPGDAVGLRDAREDGGWEPESAVGELARRGPALAPSASPMSERVADAGQLLGGVDGADVGVLVERVAEAQGAQAALEGVEHLLGDGLLDEQPGACAADVALVEEDAADDALDGLVDGGVVEDDVGGLAAELEGELLAAAGERAADHLADVGRAR